MNFTDRVQDGNSCRRLHDAAAAMGPDGTRTAVLRLAAGYSEIPLRRFLSELQVARLSAFRILANAEPTPGPDIGPTAALVGGLSAKARHDLGDTRGALAQAQSAMTCVPDGDPTGIRKWLTGLQSLFALDAGWPHEALRYARIGLALPGLATGTQAVRLHALTARAQATLGDSPAASVALRAAEDARRPFRRDELDEIGGLLHFGPVQQLAYEAATRAFIPGAERRTIESAEAALRAEAEADPPESSFHDAALARISIALAHTALDDIDAAHEAMRPVLELDPGKRISGLLSFAMIVHGRLRRPMRIRERRVRELQAEIEAFCLLPASVDQSVMSP